MPHRASHIAGKYLLGFALVLSGGGFSCVGAQPVALQGQFEQLAQTNEYFSLEVIIQNRELRLWSSSEEIIGTNGVGTFKEGTSALAQEQAGLLNKLRALSRDGGNLEALLKNPDPRVRTLALGAIFQRENGRDLPLIAGLMNDPSPTFPNLHQSFSSAGGQRPMSDLTNSQTVGDVAQAMLSFWGVRHERSEGGLSYFGSRDGPRLTTNDVAEFWKKYAGRTYAAGWFGVKMKRATRQTIPILPAYKPDIQRVLAEMESLPMPDRAWTELYVLAPDRWFQFGIKDDLVVPEGQLIGMIKKLGPGALLRFLQRQPISGDPDLLMDKDDGNFIRMSGFILRHADLLLRAKDADALLACAYVQHNSGGPDPAWAVGAALVQSARAHEILHAALARETRTYETAAGQLAGALWRIRGAAEIPFLVKWFYTELPMASGPMHQPVVFLWGVQDAGRPDTKRLIAALVGDPRFDYTDWETLAELLKIVNAGRKTPLVEETDIYDAQPNGMQDERMVFPRWRNLLRKEFRLPEKPMRLAEANPQSILTQPSWSVPLAEAPSQMIVSPDGKWLATLTNRTVAVWRTDTGQFAWQIPRAPTTGAYRVAFQTNAQLMVFHQDGQFDARFSTWDLVATRQITQALLTGKPDGGLALDGVFAFDAAASRVGFSSGNALGGINANSGKILWLHTGGNAFRPPVALSADGTRLAVGGGAIVGFYEAATGDLVRQFDQHAGPVQALALSSDGGKLVTASLADGMQLWDTATGVLMREFPYQVPASGQQMSAPVISSDGTLIAVVGASAKIDESRIGVFRTDSGELKCEIHITSNGSIGSNIALAFAPDGTMLYTGGSRLEAWPLNHSN
jgi:WD40 repeat protein